MNPIKLSDFGDPLKPIELARYWRISPDTVIRLCESGSIPGAFRIRRLWRIPRCAVEAYERGASDVDVSRGTGLTAEAAE